MCQLYSRCYTALSIGVWIYNTILRYYNNSFAYYDGLLIPKNNNTIICDTGSDFIDKKGS